MSKQINGDIKVQQEMQEFTAKTHELQTIIEKQTSELSQWQRRVSDLNNKISEQDENLSKIQKEYSKAQDSCVKLQRDLRENVAQKEDQEERITTLEKRYLNAQRESTSLHDLNEKLDQELRHKEAQIKVKQRSFKSQITPPVIVSFFYVLLPFSFLSCSFMKKKSLPFRRNLSSPTKN